MFLCVDLALFFNQYVNPIALNNIGWKYYIVYCVWLACELEWSGSTTSRHATRPSKKLQSISMENRLSLVVQLLQRKAANSQAK